jgi:molybdate transport system substrate-binding protein
MSGARSFLLALPALVLLIGGCGTERSLDEGTGAPADETLLVFAAASLKTALEEVQAACGHGFRTSYAASSALARQIEAGAPADLFISADQEWMDYLESRKLIRVETRRDLLGNGLVLIAPVGHAPTLVIGPGFELTAALGRGGRLAVADPNVVPAGKYAKAALTALGAWDGVSGRLAPAENVRAALLLVSRGEAPLGIVYRTDAAADPGVVIVGAFPDDSHPPIVYPAAVVRRAETDGRNDAAAHARAILDCLSGPIGAPIFERWGFGITTTRGAQANR